jgi:hypothetical protein
MTAFVVAAVCGHQNQDFHHVMALSRSLKLRAHET